MCRSSLHSGPCKLPPKCRPLPPQEPHLAHRMRSALPLELITCASEDHRGAAVASGFRQTLCRRSRAQQPPCSSRELLCRAACGEQFGRGPRVGVGLGHWRQRRRHRAWLAALPAVALCCLFPALFCRLCSAAQRVSSRQLVRRGRVALSTVAGEVATEQQQQQPKQQKQKQQQKQQGGGKKGERLVTPKSEDFSRCAIPAWHAASALQGTHWLDMMAWRMQYARLPDAA